jgi:hypothetical protein
MLHTEKAKLTSVLAMFGISSSAGLYRSISMSDIAAVVGLIPMQVFALYALWRSCWR